MYSLSLYGKEYVGTSLSLLLDRVWCVEGLTSLTPVSIGRYVRTWYEDVLEWCRECGD